MFSRADLHVRFSYRNCTAHLLTTPLGEGICSQVHALSDALAGVDIHFFALSLQLFVVSEDKQISYLMSMRGLH